MKNHFQMIKVMKQYGASCWYNDKNELHREDGPAVEWFGGGKEWYINGICHREGGPAEEYTDGTKHWYINGIKHREDGPASEYANGEKVWYYNGELIGYSENGFTQEDFERYLKIKEYW